MDLGVWRSRNGDGVGDEDEADNEAVEQVPGGGALQAPLQGGELAGECPQGADLVPQEPEAGLQMGGRGLHQEASQSQALSARPQGPISLSLSTLKFDDHFP